MDGSPVRVSVLTIGDELLSGEVVDTNLASIGRSISELGLVVGRHVTVGDDRDEIVRWVRDLCSENDVLVDTTGSNKKVRKMYKRLDLCTMVQYIINMRPGRYQRPSLTNHNEISEMSL